MEKIITDALSVFPDRLKKPVKEAAEFAGDIYEIRCVGNKAVYFFTSDGIRFISKTGRLQLAPDAGSLVPSLSELDEISDRAIRFSGFFYEKQLSDGFITYGGSCRMGICTASSASSYGAGKINSVSIRIPCIKEYKADEKTEYVLKNFSGGMLIAGAPASGKTTLLRSFARLLSDGFSGKYRKISVIDERGELAGDGTLGFCTDIISGKDKCSAILHALRLMSPEIIICDEIGNEAEARALIQGLNSGVGFIGTIHAGNISQLIRRRQFRLLFDEGVVDSVVFLSSLKTGEIDRYYTRKAVEDEIYRLDGTVCGNFDDGILLYRG